MQGIRKSECTGEVQSNARQGTSHVRSRVVMPGSLIMRMILVTAGEMFYLCLHIYFLGFDMEKNNSDNNCALRTENYESAPQELPKAAPEAHYRVYKLTSPENKVYIGYTGETMKCRMRKGYHRHEKTVSSIAEAIKRFGLESFRIEILCDHLTLEGAWKLEDWFIRYYDSMNPEKGYNRVSGGAALGRSLSDEYRQAISKTLLRRYENDPSLSLQNQKSKKKVHENRPELREAIRQTMKRKAEEGLLDGFVHASSKPRPVICVETGVLYSSQKNAEQLTGLGNIHKACHGHNHTCGGMHWRFVEPDLTAESSAC